MTVELVELEEFDVVEVGDRRNKYLTEFMPVKFRYVEWNAMWGEIMC